jgi:hypothetical protein
MTSSKSNASINKLLLVIAALLVTAGIGMRTAAADRKRVVILAFEGEKAEKFHASMVKLVKKNHTVVSTEKWETTAEGLGAAKVSEKNIKKVAKKMKVDGVIEGSITKRRDEYMIKLKLRTGKDGTVSATASVKAEGTKLDGSAAKEIKDELIAAIDSLESADGDDDAKPAKKGKKDDDDDDKKPAKKGKKDDDDDDKKPAKKGKKDDDDDKKPAKKGKKDDDDDAKPDKKSKFGNGGMKDGKDANGKKDDDKKAAKKDDDDDKKAAKKDDDDDKKPAKKDDDDDKKPTKKGGKKVASKKGGGDEPDEKVEKTGEPGVKMEAATALSAGNRAIDATIGVSLNARRLIWTADADLPSSADAGAGKGKPPNYKGVPAPGAVLDLTAYPLAFGHSNASVTKDIGLNIMYDKALLISSEAGGEKLTTKSSRFLIGPTFRYPLGKGPGAPVVGGTLRYGKQQFSIDGADLPNVNYSMIEPGAFFKYGFGKIELNVALNYMLVSKSGNMEASDQYGGDKKSGFDLNFGGDYALKPNLFARATFKYESISHKFDGTGMMTTGRDLDPEPDVKGAKDTYIGVAFTVGYLY